MAEERGSKGSLEGEVMSLNERSGCLVQCQADRRLTIKSHKSKDGNTLIVTYIMFWFLVGCDGPYI